MLISRLAPTPTGHLHLGNARSFLAAWLAARKAGGKVILRVEDIDRERVRPELEAAQLEDLRWLGMDWDEGPDVGGRHGPYRQSERRELYRDALGRLIAQGAAFPCVCSRKDIRLAGGAPHDGEEQRYPGTCRSRGVISQRASAAWRMRVEPGPISFEDRMAGLTSINTHALVGDFVIYRKNDWPAYQLAVVVDDAAMGVTQVVRGGDLLAATARQLVLYRALELSAPTEWAHLPLVLDSSGERMAKRSDGLSIRNLRTAGIEARAVIGVLGHSLGLLPDAVSCSAHELVSHFSWEAIPRTPLCLDWKDFGR